VTELERTVVRIMRMDLKGLAAKMGVPTPVVNHRTYRRLSTLFTAAILRDCKEELLERWRLT